MVPVFLAIFNPGGRMGVPFGEPQRVWISKISLTCGKLKTNTTLVVGLCGCITLASHLVTVVSYYQT
jgi:hypothetical protein